MVTVFETGFLLCFFFHIPLPFAQDLLDEPVETLDTIEVPATVVHREERQILLPEPDLDNLSPLPALDTLIQPPSIITPANPDPRTEVVRDTIAQTKAIQKRVKPAKAERPPYPRLAREQGWEGTVVLRVHVNDMGLVEAIQTRQSSGFSILDDSAIQSVRTWTFEPARDGEFPVPVTVDLPIRFDLDE